ncbi:Serine/threonine-protein phosphatase 4 regulatory subunit 4 [Varanus komodoensis]|nr:Serine/threonine-protein phosphatase 4 regulatory subunit 4 [Varanus komodoensis]
MQGRRIETKIVSGTFPYSVLHGDPPNIIVPFIYSRDKVRSLGVLLDPELSLEAQVTAVARSAFLQLWLIHQLYPYLEYDCLATVTHELVTSRLDFCNALYVGLPLKTVRILQLVQNRAARLLTGTGHYVHMTPVLRQLHWLPIEVRAQFKVLVMTDKALNGLGPGYLKERLRPYMPTHPLRSAGEALLRNPPSGQDIQGTSVVASLPVLMRQNPSETLRRVLPKVREVLPVAGVEMQLTAAVSLLTILQEESVSIHTYSHSFLHIILQNLEHRDAGVSNAWLETLLAAIEALPKETIRHEILNPLVSKAQLSQTLQSRLVSCKILGKLANKFEAHIIKREILPLVKSLCQDVEYEVRSCMCRQLELIAQGIGTELTKNVVLPELVELARDEGSSVRLAAFETLVNLLEMFDADDRSQTVLPLVKSFCEKSFKADESILVSLSFHLGKLCNGLYASQREKKTDICTSGAS